MLILWTTAIHLCNSEVSFQLNHIAKYAILTSFKGVQLHA